MSEPLPKHPFDRLRGESKKANRAFRDYALMGEGRSLKALLERYRHQHEAWKRDPTSATRPPTTSWSTLTDWSKKYAWQERVRRWEEIVREEEKAAARKAAQEWKERRLKLIQAGFAKVAEALRALDLNSPETKPRLGEAIQALRAIVAELRIEYANEEELARAAIVGGAGRPVPPVVFVVREQLEQNDSDAVQDT